MTDPTVVSTDTTVDPRDAEIADLKAQLAASQAAEKVEDAAQLSAPADTAEDAAEPVDAGTAAVGQAFAQTMAHPGSGTTMEVSFDADRNLIGARYAGASEDDPELVNFLKYYFGEKLSGQSGG